MIQPASPVPAWLEQHPTSQPPPPVRTNKQDQPFDQIAWENFERLCLRLARVSSEVEGCRQYGVQGDDQEGIDLFAKIRGADVYRVCQCKREKEFGPAKIKAAVDEFLVGEWRSRASEFCICSIESFANRQRADAVRAQQERLSANGIKLVVWDADELYLLLKNEPRLVDDFFGREWVRMFCGPADAAGLGVRLDGHEAAQLRARFAKLYFTIFRNDDPSYPFVTAASNPS